MKDKGLIKSTADAFADSCEEADDLIFDIFAGDEAAVELFSQLLAVRVAQARGTSETELFESIEEIWGLSPKFRTR